MLGCLALSLSLASAPLSRADLEQRLDDELRARPSNLYFLPAGLLVAGGAVSTVVGAFSGVHVGFLAPTTSDGPLPWGWACLGVGVPAFVSGLVWIAVLNAVRAAPNRRIDALEARLRELDQVEQEEREDEQRRVDAALSPAVRARVRALEDRRPSVAVPIALLAGGSAGLGIGAWLGLGVLSSGARGGTAQLAGAVTGLLAGAALLGTGVWRLKATLEDDDAIDEQLAPLRAAPPLLESKLPPAPLLFSFALAL